MKVELPLSTIAEVRKNGTAGDVYRVEGYVTAGTAVEGNTFFDTIYIQDDTAGIDISRMRRADLRSEPRWRLPDMWTPTRAIKSLR